MRGARWAIAFLALAILAALPAKADVVSGLSTDLIQITSGFTGANFVVFGAIEQPEEAGPPRNQDLVVVIRGPEVDMTVRRKDRILGIWVNREQVEFTGLPGFYFLASTRPLADIASANTLQRFHLGTSNLDAISREKLSPAETTEFRAAVIRDREREDLYREGATGIEFLSPTLFRARVQVPASVPPGEYRAEVYLFQAGTAVSAQSSPLFIDQTGIERQVYNYSNQQSLAYGLAAVFMSLSIGWLGYFLFRQRA